MVRWLVVAVMGCGVAVGQVPLGAGQGGAWVPPVPVPTAPPMGGVEKPVRDGKFGVSFKVPPGWAFTTRDHEVSTFRMDARSSARKAEMRGVVAMEFNPFPRSTLSGAMVYFSVARRSSEGDCARQAKVEGTPVYEQDIGGMEFLHGHDEHGGMCVEARDDVYTAFRRGSCYRFDLEVNTFCAASSGAIDLTDEQMRDLEARMANILSSVRLDWRKDASPAPVPPPIVEPGRDQRRRLPSPSLPASRTGR